MADVNLREEMAALRDLISRDQTSDMDAVQRIDAVCAQLKSRAKDVERLARQHGANDAEKVAFDDLITELENISKSISSANANSDVSQERISESSRTEMGLIPNIQRDTSER